MGKGGWHIWTFADGGTAAFRFRRCFHNQSTARNTVANWKKFNKNPGTRRPEPVTEDYMVLACRGEYCGCECYRPRLE